MQVLNCAIKVQMVINLEQKLLRKVNGIYNIYTWWESTCTHKPRYEGNGWNQNILFKSLHIICSKDSWHIKNSVKKVIVFYMKIHKERFL